MYGEHPLTAPLWELEQEFVIRALRARVVVTLSTSCRSRFVGRGHYEIVFGVMERGGSPCFVASGDDENYNTNRRRE